MYEKNPLTLKDFYRYLNNKGYKSNELIKNIVDLFKNIMKAVNIPTCNRRDLKDNVRFQLFGADIAPDNNLGVKLIEINKGPDSRSKR